MDYIYIVFNSRQDAIFIANVLKERGINANLVSTPKSFNVGCGLSIKLGYVYLSISKKVLDFYHPKSVKGIFYAKNIGSRIIIKPL